MSSGSSSAIIKNPRPKIIQVWPPSDSSCGSSLTLVQFWLLDGTVINARTPSTVTHHRRSYIINAHTVTHHQRSHTIDRHTPSTLLHHRRSPSTLIPINAHTINAIDARTPSTLDACTPSTLVHHRSLHIRSHLLQYKSIVTKNKASNSKPGLRSQCNGNVLNWITRLRICPKYSRWIYCYIRDWAYWLGDMGHETIYGPWSVR